MTDAPAMIVHGVPVTEEQRAAGLAAMVGRFRAGRVARAVVEAGIPRGDVCFRTVDRLLQSERKAGRIRFVKGWWERLLGEGKHTPGPWQVVRYGDGDSLVVHDARGGMDHIEANARLIAAAPDLLEALQRLIVNARFDWLGRDDCTAVHAAIAKARGKS